MLEAAHSLGKLQSIKPSPMKPEASVAAEKDGGTSSPKKLIRHRLIQLFAVPPTVQQILPYVGHRDQTIVVFQRCNPGLTPAVGITHVGHLSITLSSQHETFIAVSIATGHASAKRGQASPKRLNERE